MSPLKVRQFVTQPTTFPEELLATNLADVPDIAASVQKLVPFKAAVLRKCFIANGAFKTFKARVRKSVTSQVVTTGKLFLANLALVDLVEVNHLMLS